MDAIGANRLRGASVGRSPGRTPIKHFLLDKLVGQINGSLSTGRSFADAPLLCVDLCAGDGVKSESGTASPLIFQKHCGNKYGRANDASLVLIERDRASFDLLRHSVERFDWIQTIHGDAREYVLPKLPSNQAVFVHCDPNNVHQTPLTKEFVNSFTRCTTYLATLGCNAGGIKRLPIDERVKWNEYVQILVDVLPSWHDAILFWLVKDHSQWAYLCNVPIKWREKTISLATSGRAVDLWEKGVGGVSLRANPLQFMNQLRRLFLTTDELSGQERIF